MRKADLPKKIHFGLLQCEAENASQKSLASRGLIESTDVESICLKDPSFGTDLMTATKPDHKDIVPNLGNRFNQQCGLKFKGQISKYTGSSLQQKFADARFIQYFHLQSEQGLLLCLHPY